MALAIGAASSAVPAQGTPADTLPRDSVGVDSTRAQRLAPIRVDVTRQEAATNRLPWAVGTQTTATIRGAQPTLGIDEALANIPGVVVANRYNYALDQRISIRGAGSRANFGLRGVKVLLDGIPQSLPDGQSQLTNVDLAAISRVEVLRGSASSLYGNGSGGVIAFTTDLSAPDPLGLSWRQMGGSYGLAKSQFRLNGRAGNSVGALSVSRTTVDGFRQYSAAQTHQILGALDRALQSGAVLSLRAGLAETPKALNPGPLSAAEYEANPDTAAVNNVNRGASREVAQRYLSLRLRHTAGPLEWSAATYGQWRTVDNALAAAPPDPAGPTNGIFNTIDRQVLGARVDVARALTGPRPIRVAGGFDLQHSFDLRMNQVSTGGRPTTPDDTILVNQDERTLSVGPFAQAQIDLTPSVTMSVGARWDRLRFQVDDHFFGDGDDDSGTRTMTAASGHVGVVWRARSTFAPYANIATAFETPTTTELQARPDGTGGFNPELGPQRIRTVEVGARGRVATRLAYELALFEANATDAIIQFLETDGRAYFRNAGSTRSRGLEFGVTAEPLDWLELRAAWTHADYQFTEYRLQNGLAVDTLDGNALAGVPRNVLRAGARSTLGAFSLDMDYTTQSSMYGDDRNTLLVEGWGAGQLNLRGAWSRRAGRWQLEPFFGVQNLLDERYVAAVTLNGFGGRVREPAPRRNWYAGLELRAPLIR